MASNKKFTKVSRIVCWKCGKGGAKGDSPLRKISETDYVCFADLSFGAPTIAGQSEVPFNLPPMNKEDMRKIVSGPPHIAQTPDNKVESTQNERPA